MKVTIGVINQEAQRTAHVSNSEACAYFANLIKPFNRYQVDYLYATAEQNFTSVDGTMMFLPRNNENVILNAGIVTDELFGGIEISFDIAYDIKGLTIDFGKAYPVDFTIESDNNTVSITGNTTGSFVTEEVFPQTTFIRFVPSAMVNGQGRLRIHQITMGIGIYFDNQKILNASLKESISPISEDMPTLDFNFTIDNQDKTFDIENEKSSINFLETGQECTVQYGYDIEDDNTEWVPGAKLFLKTWSADDKQMKCTAVDRFDYMQGSFYKGRYYIEGISLYTLAIDVLTNAGVDPREYWIDGYLKDVIVYNPVPVVSHKEALQIIANAGRCILTQDREAKIYMKSSFIPDMAASSDNETYFSKAANILTANVKDVYGMAAHMVTAVGGTQFFLPRTGGSYLNTGYISEAVSGENGLFASNPLVTINLEASFKCFSLAITFGGNPPEQFLIHTYLENVPVEDIVVTGIGLEAIISREFSEFDKIEFEFIKTMSYNRIIVDYVKFGDVTDYKLEKALDLTKMPVGNKLEKVKELQVTRTMYNHSGELEELLKETVVVSAMEDEFTFELSNASYGYVCTIEDAGEGHSVEILDTGAFNIKVRLNGFQAGTEATVVVTGYEYAITMAKTIHGISNVGRVESWTNPLVSTVSHAKDLGEWIGDYMAADREYDINYRGDPRIDANDILFLDNDYIPDMKIRVHDHTLNFNGTLSGSMKGRRIMNVGNT